MNARYFEKFIHVIRKAALLFKLPFKFYLTFFPIPVNDYWLFTETKHMGIVPQILTGSFERYSTKILCKIIKPGWIIYDIGANIGYYTILFSKLTGMKGKVYSFEPDQDNCRLLQKNIKLNGGGL